MSARNLGRSIWFGTMIGLMCSVCMLTLAYIFHEMQSIDVFMPPVHSFGLSTSGWLVIIVACFLMSRKIVRTVVG